MAKATPITINLDAAEALELSACREVLHRLMAHPYYDYDASEHPAGTIIDIPPAGWEWNYEAANSGIESHQHHIVAHWRRIKPEHRRDEDEPAREDTP